METIDNLNQNAQPLEITENSKMYLKITSKWTNFMAILNFIGMGFLVLAGIVMIAKGSFMENFAQEEFVRMPFRFLGTFYVVLGIVLALPALYLFRFSKKTINALENQDTLAMETAFKNMKCYWKFMGIMTIVMLALIPIMAIVSASAVIMAR